MFTFNNKWFSLDYSIPLGKKRDFNSFYRKLLSALKTEFVIKSHHLVLRLYKLLNFLKQIGLPKYKVRTTYRIQKETK